MFVQARAEAVVATLLEDVVEAGAGDDSAA